MVNDDFIQLAVIERAPMFQCNVTKQEAMILAEQCYDKLLHPMENVPAYIVYEHTVGYRIRCYIQKAAHSNEPEKLTFTDEEKEWLDKFASDLAEEFKKFSEFKRMVEVMEQARTNLSSQD